MLTVTRYNNRKLYFNGQYLKIQDLTDMVISGRPVRVIEHDTKNDITHRFMAQIVGNTYAYDSRENFTKLLQVLNII